MDPATITRYEHMYDGTALPSSEARRINNLLGPRIVTPKIIKHRHCGAGYMTGAVDAKGRSLWVGHEGYRFHEPVKPEECPNYESVQFQHRNTEGYTLIIEYDDRTPGKVSIRTSSHLSKEDIQKMFSE